MARLTRRQVLKGAVAAGAAVAAGGAARAGTARRRRVVVVGAGAFGGWTAWHLRALGADVTLVDAWGPGNARASSGGETRVIRSLYGEDRVYVDWVRRSFELWRQAERDFDARLYERTGALWIFPGDDDYARRSVPLVEAGGLEVEKLSLAAAARRYPQVAFAGARHVYVEPEAGYLRAREACRALAGAFGEAGGRLERAAAAPGRIAGGEMGPLQLALAPGGQGAIEADAYVFACGPWLGQLFPELLGDVIRPTRQEVHYFGTPKGTVGFDREHCPVWVEFGERIFYGVPDGEGRGFKVADDTRGAAVDPTTMERRPSAEGIERARAFLARRFPGLQGAPLLEARVCQYENSPDGHFVIDHHPRAGNAWVVGGGSGHGFKLSPALGEHVARAVLGLAPPEPFFALSRLEGAGRSRTQMERREASP